ncbi:AAA family ATPase [Anabaena azotica]|uniref:AAA family ATPase n=1 Tax=Anabaena azotica TaxID=197653 RepID=UPI0039A71513
MLKSVKIENFRGFKSFELQQLGRINLLVGENNSGKTSILEAIQLLCSRTNLEPLGEIMINRGEYFWSDDSKGEMQLDISHLFHDHKFDIDSKFSISGINNNIHEILDMSVVVPLSQNGNNSLSPFFEIKVDPSDESFKELNKLHFSVKWKIGKTTSVIVRKILPDNSIKIDDLKFLSHQESGIPKQQFVKSSSLKTEKMIELFDNLVLTPEEKVVEEALNQIDSKIQRIAPISSQKLKYSSDSRGGFLVLLSDGKRVPIGSMGDGIWRILGLALALVSAKDGYLFVDEIDTGLHFTTMSGMWKMIWDTAKRLNVQVFATTHNSDCWKSLADIAEQENITDDGIRIHRIEKGKEKSIVFNESQMVIAAERELEVR